MSHNQIHRRSGPFGAMLRAAILLLLCASLGACALREADLTKEPPTEGTIAYGLVDFSFASGACSQAESALMLLHLGATSSYIKDYGSAAAFPTGWSISIDPTRYPSDGIYYIDYWETSKYSGSTGHIFSFSKK